MLEKHLRCFIAIGLPERIKGDIGEVIEVLKKCNGDVKWVSSEHIHLTLKFLGGTPEHLLTKIGESLSTIVLSYEPFYIKICNMGTFPSIRHPRVIWIGVEDSEIVKRLQKDIEDSMVFLGYEREERTFHPHLTIGRIRSQKGVPNLMNRLDSFKAKDFGSTKVDDIKLMRSELKPTGAEYYCSREIALGGRKNVE